MRRITLDQAFQIIALLTQNADWDDIDFGALDLQNLIIRDPRGAGARFTTFLKYGARLLPGCPNALVIDRTKPFDAAKAIGSGWAIWRGPKDGNGLEGPPEEDIDSLKLHEIDFGAVTYSAGMTGGEEAVTGEEKLGRLIAAGLIQLDAEVALSLFRQPDQTVLNWLFDSSQIDLIEFTGTVLRSPEGERTCLHVFRSSSRRWVMGTCRLSQLRGSCSAVINRLAA